jgi:hypothetical protein
MPGTVASALSVRAVRDEPSGMSAEPDNAGDDGGQPEKNEPAEAEFVFAADKNGKLVSVALRHISPLQ